MRIYLAAHPLSKPGCTGTIIGWVPRAPLPPNEEVYGLQRLLHSAAAYNASSLTCFEGRLPKGSQPRAI